MDFSTHNNILSCNNNLIIHVESLVFIICNNCSWITRFKGVTTDIDNKVRKPIINFKIFLYTSSKMFKTSIIKT